MSNPTRHKRLERNLTRGVPSGSLRSLRLIEMENRLSNTVPSGCDGLAAEVNQQNAISSAHGNESEQTNAPAPRRSERISSDAHGYFGGRDKSSREERQEDPRVRERALENQRLRDEGYEEYFRVEEARKAREAVKQAKKDAIIEYHQNPPVPTRKISRSQVDKENEAVFENLVTETRIHKASKHATKLLDKLKRKFPQNSATIGNEPVLGSRDDPFTNRQIKDIQKLSKTEEFVTVVNDALEQVRNREPLCGLGIKGGRLTDECKLEAFEAAYASYATTDNGSCFFNSISTTLFGNESFAAALRVLLLNFILQPSFEDIMRQLTSALGTPYFSLSHYMHAALHGWADEVMTVAMSAVLRRPVHIYRPFNSSDVEMYPTMETLIQAFQIQDPHLSGHTRFLLHAHHAHKKAVSIIHTRENTHYEALIPTNQRQYFQPFTQPMGVLEVSVGAANAQRLVPNECPQNTVETSEERSQPSANQETDSSTGRAESTVPTATERNGQTKRDSSVCCCCERDFKKRKLESRPVPAEPSFIEHAKSISKTPSHPITPADRICIPCSDSIVYVSSRATQSETHGNDFSINQSQLVQEDNLASASGITLPMSSIPISNACVVCDSTATRMHIPDKVIAQVLAANKIYIPPGTKCCPSHIQKENGLIDEESLEILALKPQQGSSTLQPSDLVSLITEMSEMILNPPCPMEQILKRHCDYVTWFGLQKSQFEDLTNTLSPFAHRCESIKDTIGRFLVKLRMNLSQEALGSLFGISQSQMSRSIARSMDLLHDNFVPLHLGYDHISREDYVKQHSTGVFKAVFGTEEAAFVLDGTYLYIQKSANFQLQRDTYSGHKFRNLVKPMMIVAPDGYILDVYGMFLGKNNDATIFENMVECENGFKEFAEEKDHIIWDRGFSHVCEMARGLGFNVKMPSFLKDGEKQLSTEEANKTRLVTKIRWVVESASGRIKSIFPFFAEVIENSYLPKVEKLFKIAAAIMNAYYGPLIKKEIEDDLVTNILQRYQLSNLLQELVQRESLITRRVIWAPLTEDGVPDFPKLSMEELRTLTVGCYQIRLAPSYTRDHLQATGGYELFHHKIPAYNEILMTKMRSRHSNQTKYKTFIHYTPNGVGVTSVSGWYCTCTAGARTLGCCSHVASTIWYLSHGRHQPTLSNPGARQAASVRNALDRPDSGEEYHSC